MFSNSLHTTRKNAENYSALSAFAAMDTFLSKLESFLTTVVDPKVTKSGGSFIAELINGVSGLASTLNSLLIGDRPVVAKAMGHIRLILSNLELLLDVNETKSIAVHGMSQIKADFADLQEFTFPELREREWIILERDVAKSLNELEDGRLKLTALIETVEKRDAELAEAAINRNLTDSLSENTRSELNKALGEAMETSADLSAIKLQHAALAQELSNNELVKHFREFHAKHQIWYLAFLTTAILGMVIAVGFAIKISQRAPKWAAYQPISLPDLAWRLAVVTGLLGIAAYMGRQAVQHRALSTWADSISVQLRTFDSYIGLVGDVGQKDTLRVEFAKRVFGPQPLLKGEPEQPAPAMDLASAVDLLTRITRPDTAKPS
ncbi:hypothetical protein [Paeniglutamicibacter sp. Y32M11]|uniref:hypothetical protein n=1 Tax=Paeniglutamicibacter sp. Y32M11 TaxID=2853258 RepID=UPI001C52BECB|nr:hypothetical protein [Paeniglutamicibacter sp. Y32M11]QXQ11485.1 hypothetical protein KUF55_06265 [Paeniglutamicibacter sp. Y32M11]